jgi:hypothetical protein
MGILTSYFPEGFENGESCGVAKRDLLSTSIIKEYVLGREDTLLMIFRSVD